MQTGLIWLLWVFLAMFSISAFAEDEITEEETESTVQEELDVIGYYIPNEKKETTQISNVLSFEQMSKSGDSNASDALARVSGLSLGNDKKIIVRGLDDRYSQTLLDGAVLPSPEPNKRVAPLELFPTNFMQSILVQKTYSPQYPGEYAGGLIDLRSKTLPDLPFWSISGSLGYESGSTSEQGLDYAGGSWDFLGFDDGTRALPDTLQDFLDEGKEIKEETIFNNGLSEEELIAAGQSFTDDYEIKRQTNLPSGSLGVSYGNRWDIGLNSYGLVTSLTYKNSTSNRSEVRSDLTDTGKLQAEYDYDYTRETVDINALISGGVELGFDNRLKSTLMFIHNATDTTAQKNGDFLGEGTEDIENRYEWVARDLITSQLEGVHYVPLTDTSEFSWLANYGFGQRRAPDTRVITLTDDDEDGDYQLYRDNSAGISREFSTVTDGKFNLDARFDIPFYRFQQQGRFYSGVGYLYQTRDYDIRRFSFSGNVGDYEGETVSDTLSDDNIAAGEWEVFDATLDSDTYEGSKGIGAFYTQLEAPILFNLSATLGARLEITDIWVDTYELSGAPAEASIEQLDILPVATSTWQLSDAIQWRVAASRTLSRPSFRELAGTVFYDIETGDALVGNPELEISNITNLDTRVEWYGTQGDSLSIGIFYKGFNNAIEQTVIVSADEIYSYENIKQANNYGAELEGFYYLSFLSDRLANFSVSGNLTYIDSSVEFTDEQLGLQTDAERAMQGQSDWLGNAQFAYENISDGTTFVLSYNYTGERISRVGTQGFANTIDEAHSSLDMTFKQNIPNLTGYKWGFKVSNLLADKREFTQNGYVTRSYDEPLSVSINLSKAWEDIPVDIYADD